VRSQPVGEEAEAYLLIKVHPPLNLGANVGGESIHCSMNLYAEGKLCEREAQKHVIASDPVVLHVATKHGLEQNIQLCFLALENEKLVAETVLPLAKLLEYGVSALPIWSPVWLALLPGEGIQHDAKRFGLLFDEARHLAQRLMQPKVCIEINASQCEKWFPCSAASVQNVIAACNEQINAYHTQSEESSQPSPAAPLSASPRPPDMLPERKLTVVEPQDASRVELLEEISKLKQEVSDVRLPTAVSERFRQLCLNSEAELQSAREELFTCRSELELSDMAFHQLRQTAQDASQLAEEDHRWFRELASLLQEKAGQLKEEQLVAHGQKSMLELAQNEVSAVCLKWQASECHVESEEAECERLRAALSERTTAWSEQMIGEEAISGRVQKSGRSPSTLHASVTLKRLLEESQAERKEQIQLLRSCVSGSISPLSQSHIPTDTVFADLSELRQEAAKLRRASTPKPPARVVERCISSPRRETPRVASPVLSPGVPRQTTPFISNASITCSPRVPGVAHNIMQRRVHRATLQHPSQGSPEPAMCRVAASSSSPSRLSQPVVAQARDIGCLTKFHQPPPSSCGSPMILAQGHAALPAKPVSTVLHHSVSRGASSPNLTTR